MPSSAAFLAADKQQSEHKVPIHLAAPFLYEPVVFLCRLAQSGRPPVDATAGEDREGNGSGAVGDDGKEWDVVGETEGGGVVGDCWSDCDMRRRMWAWASWMSEKGSERKMV